MPVTLTEPIAMPAASTGESNENSMRAQLWSLLAGMYPDGGLPERRRQERFPYPRLVHLNPVAADGQTPLGGGLVVAGKHLSERGLGFYHPTPLPYRWVVASLEKGPDEWLSLLLDVSWCRFSRRGWYESGGRFLRTVVWPRERLPRHTQALSSQAG
jgi:hypothetical protein